MKPIDFNTDRFKATIHAHFWLLGLLLINLPQFNLTVGVFRSGNGSLFWPSIIGAVFNALVFYGNWKWLLPQYIGKIRLYLFLLFVSVCTLSVLETAIDYWLVQVIPLKVYAFSWAELFTDNLLMTILFFLIPSYGFWFWDRWQNSEKVQQELRAEKLKAELSLMRSQVNPHFLFNVLNNLFASAYKFGDKKTADGISVLADMMRYQLYNSTSEKVQLKEEIAYLEDYISLQKLRFSINDPIKIEFVKNIADETVKTPPMLLIAFVENAFKHGIRLQQPSEIIINLHLGKEGKLIFTCRNTLHSSSASNFDSEHSSGFGLSNSIKRLELLFPRKHKLNITQEMNNYKVELALELTDFN